MQLKVAQGADYKLEESVTMETELIELRAHKYMTTLQVSETLVSERTVVMLSMFIIILVQMETLEQEKRQLSLDLEEAFRRHKEDIEVQQMHYFQVIIMSNFSQLVSVNIEQCVYSLL